MSQKNRLRSNIFLFILNVKKIIILQVLVSFLFFDSHILYAFTKIPNLEVQILDEAQFLTKDQRKTLENKLGYAHAEADLFIAIYFVNQLRDRDIGRMSARVFEEWKLSHKNNGILILLLPRESYTSQSGGRRKTFKPWKMSVEVSTGLQTIITNEWLRFLTKNSTFNLYDQNRFYEGTIELVDFIIQKKLEKDPLENVMEQASWLNKLEYMFYDSLRNINETFFSEIFSQIKPGNDDLSRLLTVFIPFAIGILIFFYTAELITYLKGQQKTLAFSPFPALSLSLVTFFLSILSMEFFLLNILLLFIFFSVVKNLIVVLFVFEISPRPNQLKPEVDNTLASKQFGGNGKYLKIRKTYFNNTIKFSLFLLVIALIFMKMSLIWIFLLGLIYFVNLALKNA